MDNLTESYRIVIFIFPARAHHTIQTIHTAAAVQQKRRFLLLFIIFIIIIIIAI